MDSGQTKSLTTFGVAALLLAVLTLAALESWIDYAGRQREVTARVEHAERELPTKAEASPTPSERGGQACTRGWVRSDNVPAMAE